jgi:hypothetical protein
VALRQPIALENASSTERPNADEFRLMLQHLLGDAATSSPASAGVVGATSLKVTEKSSTPNMSVDIAAGWVFIKGTETSPSGIYAVYNDATVNVTAAAADATNPRKDLVICRVRDSQYSGASDDAQLVYVAGTPAASPVEPDLDALGYENYAVLALVAVPALDTAITNSQITDRRTASLAWTRGRGEIARASTNTSQNGISGPTDLTGLSVTISPVTGRRYRVRGYVGITKTGSAGDVIIRISDNSTERWRTRQTYANGDNGFLWAEAEFTDGTSFFKLVLQSSAGTVDANVHNGTGTHFIVVDDVGGFLT